MPTTSNASPRRHGPAGVSAVADDGQRVSLTDLPLVAYRLSCGHVGKDYAVLKRDLIFCPDCATTKRVTAILAR